MHPFVLNYKSTYYTLHFVEDASVQQEPPNLLEAGRFLLDRIKLLLDLVLDFFHRNRVTVIFTIDRGMKLDLDVIADVQLADVNLRHAIPAVYFGLGTRTEREGISVYDV